MSRVCQNRQVQPCLNKINFLLWERVSTSSITMKYPRCFRPKLLCRPKPTRIRILNGAKLRKDTCTKVLCSCHRTNSPLYCVDHPGQCLLKILTSFAFIYLTTITGVWGNHCNTHAIYSSFCSVRPILKEYKDHLNSKACDYIAAEMPVKYEETCSDPVVNFEKTAGWIKKKYNKALTDLFGFAIDFPFNVYRSLHKLTEKEEIEEQETIQIIDGSFNSELSRRFTGGLVIPKNYGECHFKKTV